MTSSFFITFGAVACGWLGVIVLVSSAERSRQVALRKPPPSTDAHHRATGARLVGAVSERFAALKWRFGSARIVDAQMSLLSDAIANELSAGASLQQAFYGAVESAGGPVEVELEPVARRVERGQGFIESLRQWRRIETTESARLLTAVCAMSYEVGGPSAETFRHLATSLRTRRQLDNDVRAASAQAKASAVMLACLPFAAALLMSALNPGVGRLLFATPLGWTLLAVGVGLDVAGVRWMMRMVNAVS